MKNLTFDELWDEIKQEGTEKEKETIQNAEDISNIITNIVSERINQGLSQRDLAQKTGLKQSAIARIEKMQVMPRIDTLIRLARKLNLKINVEKPGDGFKSTVIYVNTDFSNCRGNIISYRNIYSDTKYRERA